MPTITDIKLSSLVDLGFTGTVNDAEFEYLGSLGHTGTLDDRLKEWLTDLGYANLKEYLLSLGYTGSVQDMLIASLTAGDFYAPVTPVADFLALIPSPDTGIMTGVYSGTGSLTTAHTATIYHLDNSNVYQSFGTDEPVWTGARHSGGVVYGTDSGGTPLTVAPYLVVQPSFTNSLKWSNDLTRTTVGLWSDYNVTPDTTQDEVGLTGTANTATTVADSNAANASWVAQRVTTVADTSTHTVRYFIKKDAGMGSVYPELHFRYSPGVNGGDGIALSIDLSDGSTPVSPRVNTAACNAVWEVNSIGDWWEVLIQADNTSKTYVMAGIMPAASNTLGGSLVLTLQASVVIGVVEVHLNKTIPEVRGAGPIFTTTASATTDITLYDFNVANHSETSGAYYLEVLNKYEWPIIQPDTQLVSTSAGAYVLFMGNTGSTVAQAKSWDSTTTSTVDVTTGTDTVVQLGLAYGTTENKKRVHQNGTWGTEGTYDGSFGTTKMDIGDSAPHVFMIRNLQRWDLGYSDAVTKIEELTAT